MFLENLETLKRKIVVSKISTQFEIFIENVKKKSEQYQMLIPKF